ncbi:MAG: NupC/NupG family nucleoside CNT transporter [Rhodothalassiaceae bacterium]
MIAIVGMAVLVGLAVLFSQDRRAISLRVTVAAFALQAGLAVLVLYVPFGQRALASAAFGAQNIINYADAGIRFLFGELGRDETGFIFAFRVLPIIVFVSSLIAVLYHIRLMQLIVIVIGGGLRRVIGSSRVESLVAAANIFIGMVESPLVVRPYLSRLSHSEMFAVMAVGLSSVSGAILAGYAAIGIDLQYLLAAAFMAAPGGLFMAKLLVPEDPANHVAEPEKLQITAFDPDNRPVNVIEAAADGAAEGLKIAAGVGAMLLAFVALLALVNGIVGWLGGLVGLEALTLEKILGYPLAPLMYLVGVPWQDAVTAGNLLGQKTILNEFLAFVSLTQVSDQLTDHGRAVITFALCGFANFSALAIVMGGLGSLVPDRRHEIAKLGVLAVISGTLANLMSAALASLLLSL